MQVPESEESETDQLFKADNSYMSAYMRSSRSSVIRQRESVNMGSPTMLSPRRAGSFVVPFRPAPNVNGVDVDPSDEEVPATRGSVTTSTPVNGVARERGSLRPVSALPRTSVFNSRNRGSYSSTDSSSSESAPTYPYSSQHQQSADDHNVDRRAHIRPGSAVLIRRMQQRSSGPLQLGSSHQQQQQSYQPESSLSGASSDSSHLTATIRSSQSNSTPEPLHPIPTIQLAPLTVPSDSSTSGDLSSTSDYPISVQRQDRERVIMSQDGRGMVNQGVVTSWGGREIPTPTGRDRERRAAVGFDDESFGGEGGPDIDVRNANLNYLMKHNHTTTQLSSSHGESNSSNSQANKSGARLLSLNLEDDSGIDASVTPLSISASTSQGSRLSESMDRAYDVRNSHAYRVYSAESMNEEDRVRPPDGSLPVKPVKLYVGGKEVIVPVQGGYLAGAPVATTAGDSGTSRQFQENGEIGSTAREECEKVMDPVNIDVWKMSHLRQGEVAKAKRRGEVIDMAVNSLLLKKHTVDQVDRGVVADEIKYIYGRPPTAPDPASSSFIFDYLAPSKTAVSGSNLRRGLQVPTSLFDAATGDENRLTNEERAQLEETRRKAGIVTVGGVRIPSQVDMLVADVFEAAKQEHDRFRRPPLPILKVPTYSKSPIDFSAPLLLPSGLPAPTATSALTNINNLSKPPSRPPQPNIEGSEGGERGANNSGTYGTSNTHRSQSPTPPSTASIFMEHRIASMKVKLRPATAKARLTTHKVTSRIDTGRTTTSNNNRTSKANNKTLSTNSADDNAKVAHIPLHHETEPSTSLISPFGGPLSPPIDPLLVKIDTCKTEAELRRLCESLQFELGVLKRARRTQGEAELQLVAKDNSTLRKLCSEMQKQVIANTLQLNERTKEVEDVQKELKAVQEELDRQRTERVEEQVQLAALEKERNSLRYQNNDLTQQVYKLRSRVRALESTLEHEP